jgi:DNA-binding response OmpR family regulator
MSARDTADLDFTQAQPAAIPPQAEMRRPAGNFIAFAKGGVPRRAPASDNAPVVVVEDDDDMRALLEKFLVSQGFQVRAAADIDQFKQAMRLAPLPRLVLLDIELPRVSGLKILSALRQHPQTAALPVVMVTARSGSKDLTQALALGADGYLTKPVSAAMLRSIIGKVLAAQP